MPKASSRKLAEVPLPTRTSRKSRLKQDEYDGYIRILEEDEVGDLELGPEENMRAVKMSLQRAAARYGIEIQVWDSGNHVYYRKGVSRKRNTPRRGLEIHRAVSNNGDSETVDLFGGQ